MKAIFVIISIAASALLAPVASAVIINIPGDYATIQEGIDAAQNGDTVLVARGEYIEELAIEDKNILLTSSNGPDVTIIRGIMIIEGDSVDSTCVLRGFNIIYEYDACPYDCPAIIENYTGSPLIVGNIIQDAQDFWGGGGGIYSRHNTIIRNNIVKDNSGTGIGGINDVVIEGNIVSGNIVYSPSHGAVGGGIGFVSGILRYNLIIDNEAASGYIPVAGGGIYTSGRPNSNRQIYNNTIVGNSARVSNYDGDGGGIHLRAQGGRNENISFKNNIIAFSLYGGGVYGQLVDSAEVDWDYNLVFGNETLDYIGIEPGPHDIQADPLFVDRFSGDYHLLPNSPCIDAGDPDFSLDPDGTRADIGAYYFDQTVGIEDPGEPSGPYRFQLHQNYPNPFNAQTIISYTLSESSVVSLMIFSITGHFVKSIINKEVQQPGEYRYIWDGADKSGQHVATGIYFYELYVDDYRESKAMIMVK